MRVTAVCCLLLGILSALPASAEEVIVFPVNRRARVLGTLRPATDIAAYTMDAPRDAIVRATAKRMGRSDLVPGIEVLDEDLEVAVAGSDVARGQTAAGEVVESGEHRFRVSSPDGDDGDYVLRVTVRPRRLWTERDGAEVAALAEATFDFAAPAGSTALFELRPLRGSAFAPELIDVSGPDGFLHAFDASTAVPRRHVARDVALGGNGEYQVRFRNVGDEAGTWLLKVRLRLLAQARTVEDFRDTDVDGESEAVVADVVGPEGGTVSGAEGSGLEDVELELPPGAAPPTGTTASIGEADNYPVDDDTNSAGQAVEVGIEGELDEDATLVAVYDEQAYDDEASEVAFAVLDEETGVVEVVENDELLDVDTDANTGTVPISGDGAAKVSSTRTRRLVVQPVSRRPRHLRGTFMELEIRGEAATGNEGAVTFALNRLHGLPGPRSGNGFTRDRARRTLRWSVNGGVADFDYEEDEAGDTGTITSDSNDEVVLASGGGVVALARGRSPNVLFRRAVGSDAVTLGLNLRRATGTPTPALLAGSYRALVWEVSGTRETDGSVTLMSSGQSAALTVGRGGAVVAHAPMRSTSKTVLPGDGTWRAYNDSRRIPPGTLVPDGEDVRLDMALGKLRDLDSVLLAPVLRGDALVGVAERVDGAGPDRVILRVVILVRADDDAAARDLNGRSIGGAIELNALDRPAPPAGVRLQLGVVSVGHDGTGTAGVRGLRSLLEHSPAGDVVADAVPVDRSARYVLRRNGSYVERPPLTAGARTRRGELLITTRFGGGNFQLRFATPARPE